MKSIKKMSWLEIQRMPLPKPRVIKAMPPHRMKIGCKAAMGKTSGGTKILHNPFDQQAARIERGRMIQMRFIERGIRLNRRVHYTSQLAYSIRQGISNLFS